MAELYLTQVAGLAVPLQKSLPDVSARPWWVLYTRSRFERKVAEQVQNKNHEAFVPVMQERRRWSDRYQTIESPMFPGYVFVRAVGGQADRLTILQTQGVYGFVTFNGLVAQVLASQIEDLRRIQQQSVPWAPHQFVAAGQRVRIRGGCLDGLEGIFLAGDPGKKLIISIGPIQRSISLNVAEYMIEPL